jgi:lipopolysaccharide biosynthesis regulator YciM
MRVRAANAPGSAAEASELASHVTTLYTQGVAKRRALSSDLLGEALACLDRARQSNPDDPELLVRKGELLVATGQRDAGSEALRQSIAVRPTLRGFNALEKIYAANNRTQDLTALCRRTLPAMKSDESRYAVLDNCLEHSGANTAEVGLAWASPKDRSFYKVRRREVETRLNAAKQQKAKDDLTAKPTAKQSR